MAYDDTKWGGFAKIIVDTSTMTAGDTVRVRSMTDANAIYDKTVVTAGTPLLFETEIFKDYVKICTVQEIGGVATEIGGVYRTVDYGQTLFIDVLDKTTLAGIQGILNAHQESELLAIGNEATIKVGGNDWTVQTANIDGTNHVIDFISKNLYSTTNWSSGGDTWYSNSNACSQADSFYSNISASDKQYIKSKRISCAQAKWGTSASFETLDKYIWLPKQIEIEGIAISGDSSGYSQFAIFTTQANRVKTYNGTAISWWSCDGTAREANPRVANCVNNSGTRVTENVATSIGILPCFRMTADA